MMICQLYEIEQKIIQQIKQSGNIKFFRKRGIQVKFFTDDQNVGKSLKCILTKNFLRLAVFKILQFKVNDFPLTSVLPFCQYCDRKLSFEKVA